MIEYTDPLVKRLRSATEDDVELVLTRMTAENIPLDSVGQLEFFNRMIDELTGERAAAEEADDIHIADLANRARGD